jgi:hypothetical protein
MEFRAMINHPSELTHPSGEMTSSLGCNGVAVAHCRRATGRSRQYHFVRGAASIHAVLDLRSAEMTSRRTAFQRAISTMPLIQTYSILTHPL